MRRQGRPKLRARREVPAAAWAPTAGIVARCTYCQRGDAGGCYVSLLAESMADFSETEFFFRIIKIIHGFWINVLHHRFLTFCIVLFLTRS